MLNEGTSTWNLSDTPVGKYIADFLVFLILYYGFVPLSVYITMEIVNLFHSFSINWDEQMYHLETNTPANTRTAALAEDLGQIEYIFSDKTGTLTQNVMVFRVCTTAPTAEEDVGTTYGIAATSSGECSFLYRYILCESCSQFDSLPLTYLTTSRCVSSLRKASMSASRGSRTDRLRCSSQRTSPKRRSWNSSSRWAPTSKQSSSRAGRRMGAPPCSSRAARARSTAATPSRGCSSKSGAPIQITRTIA